MANETVDHPPHYGGADNPYEAIKVIEAWDLGFQLGNAVKYIARAGKKGDELEDLKKAAWYLQRQIKNVTKQREREAHDRLAQDNAIALQNELAKIPKE
jgi:hypothetical protein